MKSLLPITLTLLLFSPTSFATNVSGGIYSNTTWSLSNSPYIVTGDIVVFDAATLTIEPGVQVLVDSSYKIEIRGKLLALGTSAKKIAIKGNSSDSSVAFWQGITFGSTASYAKLTYCSISNAVRGIYFYLAWGPYYFDNCLFNYNWYASYEAPDIGAIFDSCSFVHNNTAIDWLLRGTVKNCSFDSNVFGITEGIDSVINCQFINNSQLALDPNGYTANCQFLNNGIAVEGYFNSKNNTFINNKIKNNNIGVSMLSYFNGSINFSNNEICSNTTYNIKLNTSNNCDLSNNCWCTTDSAAIRSKIYDGYVDISRGLVSFNHSYVCSPTAIHTVSQSDELKVYPNPANSTSKIAFPLAIQAGTIRIYNALGQLVKQESFTNKKEYFIGNLGTSGFYYYGLFDDNLRQRYSGKFVYE